MLCPAQGTPDSIPIAESVQREHYSLRYTHEYYGKAYRDPYAYQSIFFATAERLGYRISYVEAKPSAPVWISLLPADQYMKTGSEEQLEIYRAVCDQLRSRIELELL